MKYRIIIFSLLLITISCTSTQEAAPPPLSRTDGQSLNKIAAPHNETASTEKSEPQKPLLMTSKELHEKFFPRLDVMIAKNDPNGILREFSRLTQYADLPDIAEALRRIHPFLAALSVEKIASLEPVEVGTAVSSPCSIRVTVHDGTAFIPLAGITCLVADVPLYAPPQQNKLHIVDTITTDKNGVASYMPPVSDTPVNKKIVLLPQFFFYPAQAAGLVLREQDNVYADLFTPFMQAFFYKVKTVQTDIPIDIALLDFSELNEPKFDSTLTAARLLSGLLRSGFRNVHTRTYAEIVNENNEIIVPPKNSESDSERLIIIQVHITELYLENNLWVCRLNAFMTVYNYNSLSVIAEFSVPYTAKGKTKAQARASGRAGIGGTALVEAIQYGIK